MGYVQNICVGSLGTRRDFAHIGHTALEGEVEESTKTPIDAGPRYYDRPSRLHRRTPY